MDIDIGIKQVFRALRSDEIYNLIRAVTHPYPGAFTYNSFDKIFKLYNNKD